MKIFQKNNNVKTLPWAPYQDLEKNLKRQFPDLLGFNKLVGTADGKISADTAIIAAYYLAESNIIRRQIQHELNHADISHIAYYAESDFFNGKNVDQLLRDYDIYFVHNQIGPYFPIEIYAQVVKDNDGKTPSGSTIKILRGAWIAAHNMYGNDLY